MHVTTPFVGLLKKTYLTAKHAKNEQSTQRQANQHFAIFATFAVNGFPDFFNSPILY